MFAFGEFHTPAMKERHKKNQKTIAEVFTIMFCFYYFNARNFKQTEFYVNLIVYIVSRSNDSIGWCEYTHDIHDGVSC